MREFISIVIRILIGVGAGVTISGGVVAFITIIGIIPMLAHHTKTGKYFIYYENTIIVGAIIGSILSIWDIKIPMNNIIISGFVFFFGVFVGGLIIALAEVLNVFPIINRRVKVRKGISFLILALALGKLTGSLLYWLYPMFYSLME